MDHEQTYKDVVSCKVIHDNSDENEHRELTGAHTIPNVVSSNIECIRCQLCDEDVTSMMASLVRKDMQVSSINLSENNIHDNGAISVANFLKLNHKLLSVNLSNNMIADKGAIAIAKALSINSAIQRLDLSNNDFGLEGLQTLMEALEANSTIEELLVWDDKRWSPKFERLEMKIHHYLLLNRAGRRVVLDGPLNLVPFVLERVNENPNTLFGLLLELPHLWKGASNRNHIAC